MSLKNLSLILNGGDVSSTIEISKAVMSVLPITGNSKVMTLSHARGARLKGHSYAEVVNMNFDSGHYLPVDYRSTIGCRE